MKSNELMICEYFCKSLFSYLAVACAPPFFSCLASHPLKGRQHTTTAACPRNQREKTDYYQRNTIIFCDKISA